MRSDQIHRALAKGITRYEVCQLVSKGVKATHKTGSRFEDSINMVLDYINAREGMAGAMHTEEEMAVATRMRPAA